MSQWLLTAISAVVVMLYVLSCSQGAESFIRSKRKINDEMRQLVWINREPISSDLNIFCSSGEVNITVTSSYTQSLEVGAVKELHFIDENGELHSGPSCVAQQSNSEYHFTLRDSFGQCSSSIEARDDFVFVNYTIYVVPQHDLSITRDAINNIHFTCQFHQELDVVMNRAVDPVIRQEKFLVETVNADVDLTMKRFSNDSFNEVIADSDVTTATRVYVGVDLLQADGYDFVLRGVACWATPESSALNSALNYDIISNGCPAADLNLGNANMVFENFQSNRFLFSFTAFLWSSLPADNQKVYVHCNVKVCDNRYVSNACTAPISSPCPDVSAVRRKRDLSPGISADDDVRTVTLGPIRMRSPVHQEQPLCDKISMGCEHDCAVRNDGEAVCICSPNFILNVNGKSCSLALDRELGSLTEDLLSVYQKEYDLLYYYIVYSLIGLIISSVGLIVAISSYCKHKKIAVQKY